jgi:hypothetical protein
VYFKPRVEELEPLLAPSVTTISVLTNPVFSYTESDGDRVQVLVLGSAGSATLCEQFGDGDGILEDGETLGDILIRGASTDFRLQITLDTVNSTGDRTLRLGQIDAEDQAIESVFAQGLIGERITAKSFQATCLASWGGFWIDELTGNANGDAITLAEHPVGSIIDVNGNVNGRITIANDVAGTIDIEGFMLSNLTVGGSFHNAGFLRVGGSLSGETVIGKNFNGRALIGKRAYGRFTILGNVSSTALLQAGGDFNQVRVVRGFHGRLYSGTRASLDIGDSVGPTAYINTASADSTVILVGGYFHGAARAANYLYLQAGKSITSNARLVSNRSLVTYTGSGIEFGAYVSAPITALNHIPAVNLSGTAIDVLPYAITSPGYYQLRSDLVFEVTGTAIEIAADNVVVDLNGFSLLATAGPANLTTGILSDGHSNLTVKNGTIGGFQYGVRLSGLETSYNLIDDVRAAGNFYLALWIEGNDSVIRNSVVVDHGGSLIPSHYIPIALRLFGIRTQALNNTVTGIRLSSVNREWVGIHLNHAPTSLINGNIICAATARKKTWGMWINGGTASAYTDSLILDNTFINMETALEFSYARGGYSGNRFVTASRGVILGTNYGLNTFAS